MPPQASGSSAVPKLDADADLSKLELWKGILYDKVMESHSDSELLSQDALLDLDVVPNRDLALLIRVVQSLVDSKLFVTMNGSTGLLWKWRAMSEASKYTLCDSDEAALVYSFIDDAGGDGIWSQTLQRRTNMHDSVMKNALKHLQAKGLIEQFKSIEHPNKKMYIKTGVKASERASGGSFYTDNSLDEAFISELCCFIYDTIKQRGSYLSRSGGSSGRSQTPKKGVLKGVLDKGKKRDAGQMNEPPSKAVKIASTDTPRKEVFLPMPAGFKGYPTVRDIARFLIDKNITNGTVLSEADVKKLVDVLCWDNLIESVKIAGKVGYRVVRPSKQSIESWAAASHDDPAYRGPETYVSAYTEAPCGQCPVFDLCEDGGPVGPSNCTYFQRWLGAE